MIGVYIEAGLSNRLFKMIFAYAMSKKYTIPFRFENWDVHSHHTTQVYEDIIKRFQALPLYCNSLVTYEHRWTEPSDEFMNYLDIASLVPEIFIKNVYIHGFFQNEKYFKEYRGDIQALLAEPESIMVKLQQYKEYLPIIENSYFLHIRLGDYLQLPKHWVNLNNYYTRCLEDIAQHTPNANFVIFSNQVSLIGRFYPQLQNDLKRLGMNYIVVDDQDELVCFYLMKRCKRGGICSNSTFGWWASWLNDNENKRVYMPSKWINMEVKNDIYPEGTIIIDV